MSRDITAQELYVWLITALEIAKPCCEVHKHSRLRLRFLVDENENLIDWYICCPVKSCYREYTFLMTFYPIVIPDEGGK